jgi:hypothetical protein
MLEDYETEEQAKRGRDEMLFTCKNNHSVTVYSSDPYYPDWVECPECGRLMEHSQENYD